MLKLKKRVPGQHTADFNPFRKVKDINSIDKNQENLIFQFLTTGAKLDQLSAKLLFSCVNLPEIIHQIKQSGVDILTKEIWVSKTAKIFQYQIKSGSGQKQRREQSWQGH